MKEYEIKVEFRGAYLRESRKCPIDWLGSGVFDIEEQEDLPAVFNVIAESEDSAKKIVEAYEFKEYYGQVRWIDIKSVEVLADAPDEDGEDILSVLIGEDVE